MGIYETRQAAERDARGDETVLQVGGGYIVTTWRDAFLRYREKAGALQAGGWTSADKEEMMQEYHFDEEHAGNIVYYLTELEEEMENEESIY